MQALKLTSNADEKRQLKTRCGALIDVADRIKKSEKWTPSVDPNTTEAQIGRRAASIDPRHSLGTAYQDAGSVWPGSSSHHGTLEHTPRSGPPEDLLSASGNSPISSTIFPPRTQHLSVERLGSTLYRDDSRHISMPLLDLSDDQSQSQYGSWRTRADTQHEGNQQTHNMEPLNSGSVSEATQSVFSPLSQFDYQRASTAADGSAERALEKAKASNFVSPVHVHRLIEPLSTRKRTRKEDIILLKASVVNGFKCPPWDKSPAAAEFLWENGQNLFQYVRIKVLLTISN